MKSVAESGTPDEDRTDPDGGLVKFYYQKQLKSGEILLDTYILTEENSSRAVDALARVAVYAGRHGGRVAACQPGNRRDEYNVLLRFRSDDEFSKFYQEIFKAMPDIFEDY